MAQPDIVIFGDGACKGNPGPGGWGTLIVTPDLLIERGGFESDSTNNRMEAMALLSALDFLKDSRVFENIWICFDSKYVLQAAKYWLPSWKRNSWKTKTGGEVKNQDIWRAIEEILSVVKKKHNKIHWKYVPGHSGYMGNERVDEIASSYADELEVFLARSEDSGEWDKYTSDIQSLEEIQKSSFGNQVKPDAGYPIYLSVVGGNLYKDKSWSQCEARVKGVAGAKFKKAKSKAEELSILKSWKL